MIRLASMLLQKPPALLAFALRRTLIPFSALLAELAGAQVFEAVPVAWALPPALDDEELVALLEVLRAIPTPGHTRGPLHAAERELWARGRIAEALGDGRDPSLPLFDEAWRRLEPSDLAAWTAAVGARLEVLIDDPRTDTLELLAGAKVALQLLPALRREAVLARLSAAYEAEDARGDYDELDYPYGTIDPALEMARTFARAGRTTEALGYVGRREERFAQLFNAEELEECARLVEAVPDEVADDLEDRFTRWARASTDQEDPAVYLSRWLTRSGRSVDGAARAELLRIIDEARAGEALSELVDNERAPGDLRDAAQARLVALVEAHVGTLAAIRPASSPARDWAGHAFAVRQLGAALVGLGSRRVVLDPADRAVIAAAARRWSAWFATESTSDWLDPAHTAIGFARLVPGSVSEAARRFDDMVRAGQPFIVKYEGFEALLGEERAVEIARGMLS
jgi:hypothetical protein